MRHSAIILTTLLMLLIGWTAAAERISDIASTKHNLSISGPGTVTANAEDRICVFCHIPHQPGSAPAPLWNRQLSGSTYTPYVSGSLDATDIQANPGGSSKLCLSCHDGTIAIGSVNVLEGSQNVDISMSGTGTGGVMPGGSGTQTGFTRNLGIDLTNDHPISFTYDSTLASTDGELRDPATTGHIATRAPGNDPLVPLESGRLQCTSCHDPHIRDSDPDKTIKFLRLNRLQVTAPSGGLFSAADDIICLACHDKLGQAWAGSAHASSLVADEVYTAAAANQREFPANTAVWQAGCLNCHDPHTVQGAPKLLREATDSLSSPKSGGNAAMEESCYQCHSSDGDVLQGQGSAGFPVPNIKTDFQSLTRMPITTSGQNQSDEVHDIQDADLIEPPARLENSSRHAECTDCHNPHRVIKNRSFNATGDTTAATHEHSAGHTNVASGALRGTWGMEPVYGTADFDPSNLPISYDIKRGDGGSGAGTGKSNPWVTREYQVCLKCHSDYAYGGSPPLLSNTAGGTTSGTNDVDQFTNQAMEFQAPLTHKGEVSTTDSGAHSNFSNNNHRSWHPVMASTGRTTSVRQANAGNWLSPWNSSADIGNQTMYCSDCHGSDTASGTVEPSGGEDGNPWGPHGSNNDFILKGEWDANTGGGATSNDLCFKCHSYTRYATRDGDGFASGFGGDRAENLHAWHADKIEKLRCSWCHTAVPHGWKNKALLVNLNDVGPEAGLPAGTQVRNSTTAGYTNGPYYLNALLKVVNFRASGTWREQDCGSSGSPGNGETGKDWMRDSSENCENPP